MKDSGSVGSHMAKVRFITNGDYSSMRGNSPKVRLRRLGSTGQTLSKSSDLLISFCF